MVQYKKGDMFKDMKEGSVYLVTANSMIKSNMKLVMGGGAAKQMRDRFERIDKYFGNKVFNTCGEGNEYRIIIAGSEMWHPWSLGIFQTKKDWRDPSTLELIRNSTKELIKIANNQSETKFNLNYPGIGLGGLSIDKIAPILEELPDNVYVWRF